MPLPFASNAAERGAPIGVDLGAAAVKAAQPTAGGGVRTAVIPRDEPGSPFTAPEFERLAGAFRRLAFTGSRVVLGAPRSLVRTTTIELPPNQPAGLRGAVLRGELGQMHGIDPSSFELAAWTSPQPPRATPTDRLVTTILPHIDADALLDAAESAGLNPLAIVPPAAGHAALTDDGPDAGRLRVILDMGWSGASLIACRDGAPLFVRPLAGTSLARLCEQAFGNRGIGAGPTSWALGPGRVAHAALGPALAPVISRYLEALSAEVRTSMTYLTQCLPDDPPREVAVAGAAASDAVILDQIEMRSGTRIVPPTGDTETRLARGLARVRPRAAAARPKSKRRAA